MMNRYCLPVGVMLIAALLFVQSSAQAAPATVVNPSFETQILANDGDVASPIDGWTYWSSAGGAGLVCNPTGYDAPGGDTAYGFLGASGSGTPLGGQGTNVLWEYEGAGQFGLFSQVLGTTLQAGNTYTLTVAMGMVPTGGNLIGELIFYTENGNLLTYADTLPSAMTSGQFVDSTLVFAPTQAQIDSYGGQRLKISLCGYCAGAYPGPGRIAFDNVRMDVVPEPGTLILLAVAGIALAWFRLRK
jgi:hypothetical protein